MYLLLIKIESENISLENKIKNNNMNYNSKSNKSKIHKRKKIDRKLENDNYFEKLNIYLDLYNFNNSFPSEMNGKKDIFINSMKKAKSTLESLIEISCLITDVLLPDSKLRGWGLDKWDEKFFGGDENGDLSKESLSFYNITNTIFFKFKSLGDDIMAYSQIVDLDVTGVPSFGVITLNNHFPESKLTSDYLEALMLHEFTHLLGFHQKTIINENMNEEDGEDDEEAEYFIGIIQEQNIEDEDGSTKTLYFLNKEKSPKVFNYFSKFFGCDEIERIDLEMDVNNNIHWPSRYLLGEYMTEFNYVEEKVISRFTLAFLEDLGYIKIKKYSTGGLMRFGKNQGCNFLNKKCVNDGVKFENDFYYPNENTDPTLTEPSCSSGRLSRTVHKLHADVPSGHQYFSGDLSSYGGLSYTDYCPVSEYDSYVSNLFKNSCSLKGLITNDAKNIYGEAISNNSFCALNTLVKKSESNSGGIRAGCYNMFCTTESLTIQVGEDYLVCPREGGKIASENYEGYILCPDYNLICTVVDDPESNEDGNLCNDMFDCVEKEIEEKETYTYDYTSETTQDSSVYKIDNVKEGYELTEKGKCPQYCSQCKENTGCFKCKSDYGLVGTKEDINEIIFCKELTYLNSQPYYINSKSIYYPCTDAQCTACQDKNTCTQCTTNYKLVNGKCEEKVANCALYEGDICTSCKDGFGKVKEDTEISCIEKDNLEDYYYTVTEGGDIYYKKCSYGVANCNKCTSETECTECINNKSDKQYAIIGDNNRVCEDLSTNKYYFDISDNKYKICREGSEALENCEKCKKDEFNILNCLLCASPYKLVHSDEDKCIQETEIGNNYYIDDEGNYYSCSNSVYHSVEHCLTCESKETCLSCQSGYQIANSNNLCLSNSDLKKNKYVLINNVYKACSELMKGCETCTSEDKCTECNISYDLDINDKCIPTALSLTRYYKDPSTGKYISCEEITNCEECSSGTECTKCKNGYELDSISTCIEKENEKNNDYDKIKALATGAIVLGVIATVVSITAIILMFFKNILFKKRNSNIVEPTDSVNIKNDEENGVAIQPYKRSIHNQTKNNDNSE